MIKIGFVGDIFPGGLWAQKDGLTNDVLALFKPLDLRVANLETAFGDGTVQCHIKMSDPKLGNTLFCPDSCIEVLKKLGVNVVSLANNHACDCDLQGLAHTIELLDKNGIKHFGAGRNKVEAEKPAIVEIQGKIIGFLGYFPPEWEAPYPPSDSEGGLNQFNIDKVVADVKQLKIRCDYVFVMPHWGWEYTVCPRAIDVINAKRIIEAGATGVLGAHTHTVQPIIKYKGGILAIGLGNFIFPDRYIKPPRQTCYPANDVTNGIAIPFTTKFNIVDKLTITGMPPKCRTGVLCKVCLDGQKVSFKKVYTRMSDANVLEKKDAGIVMKIKIFIVGLLLVDERSIAYRIFYNRIRRHYHNLLNRFHIQHPM